MLLHIAFDNIDEFLRKRQGGVGEEVVQSFRELLEGPGNAWALLVEFSSGRWMVRKRDFTYGADAMLATSGPETQVYTQAQPLGEKLMSEARLCDTSGSNIAQRFGVAEALSVLHGCQSIVSIKSLECGPGVGAAVQQGQALVNYEIRGKVGSDLADNGGTKHSCKSDVVTADARSSAPQSYDLYLAVSYGKIG